MKRLAGQAGRTIGYLIHHTGMVIITVFFVLALVLGGLAFRFSLGPIQIPWLTSQLASMVSGRGIDIHIAHAALAWDGYKNGGGVPFYLQLEDITASNEAGVELAEIPSAHMVFFPGSLMGTQAPILVSSSNALFAGSKVPVTLTAAIHLGTPLHLSKARLHITLGAGRLGKPGKDMPISGGSFIADITPTDVAVSQGSITLARTPAGGDAPVIGFSGTGHLNQDWQGSINATVNTVQADDLAAYWPSSLADQARAWVIYNITTGAAHNARFSFGLSAPPSLAVVKLESLSGRFQADHLNVGWIPGAQPITGVAGTLTFTDKDTIDIAASTGLLGGVQLHDAHMRINGVAHKDQTTVLNIPISGSLTDALSVLNAAPLNLLQASPVELMKATGDVTGTVNASFPLKNDLKIQEVELNVLASLRNVTLPTPIEDLPFTGGQLDLQATASGLNIAGKANFAGEPAQITTRVHYGNVSPSVNFTMLTVAGNDLLEQFGLKSDAGQDDDVSGKIPLSLNIQSDLDGIGTARLDADLSGAAVSVPAFGWAKTVGQPGKMTISAGLNGESITVINSIAISAPGLEIQGRADTRQQRLYLSQLRIGASQASGSITAPATAKDPWAIDLTGSLLDVTAILNPPPPAAAAKLQAQPAPPARPRPPSGPLWTARLRFAALVLAAHNAPALKTLAFAGNGQGLDITAATASAAGDTGQPLSLAIIPDAAAGDLKTLHLETADGGYLFRALGAFNDIQGGDLNLDAAYRDSGGATGIITMKNFRLLEAPAFTKLLQRLTIYGVADAASGPGLVFDQLVAPFSIDNHVLKLKGARAFSKSLGFTASGTVATVTGVCDLDTTIVPAYALNAALGKIPLIGKLFSAEKGGGLFAVRAKITGQLTNPSVSVNPLSALTPGVLRDVFGLGGSPAQ